MSVERLLDQVFARRGDRELCADLYLPRNGPALPALIVWIHGGGWRTGTRKSGPNLVLHFAQAGFAMASIDYSSSADVVFPAQIEDVLAGIYWLKERASHFGYDGGRVGLWGSSSGGHLAALAGLTDAEAFGPTAAGGGRVQAVVDGYGPTDLLKMDEQRDEERAPRDDPESLILSPGARTSDPDSRESALFGGSLFRDPELVARANPLTHVAANAPPFLICHGLSDGAVPYSQSRLLYEKLKAAGGEVSLALFEGLGHGFFNRDHVDDRGVRRVQFRRARNCEETCDTREVMVFGLVQEFFERHLGASAQVGAIR